MFHDAPEVSYYEIFGRALRRWLVPGFVVAGFWPGFFVAIFVSVLSFAVNALIGASPGRYRRR